MQDGTPEREPLAPPSREIACERRFAAAKAGPEGDAARREYEQTLKGLGLKSRSVDRRGGATDDQSRGLTGARRTAPPAKFADRYGAYSRGIGQQPTNPEPPSK